MITARTRAELSAALEKLGVAARPLRWPVAPSGAQPGGTGGCSPGGQLVLVPTMGALHDGHRALLRRARELAGPTGTVTVSIFVNPLQFGPNEDLDTYPRTLETDLAACAAEGADLVFAPGVGDMYPQQQLVMVDPGPTGRILEGEFRPGFFNGVLTVVLKLFSLVRPDIAVFGQKDAQQLVLVRRMSADFGIGVDVAAVPTVRAEDGLALSSRNKYLSAEERAVAPVLYRALSAGAAVAPAGPGAVLAAAQAVLDDTGLGAGLDETVIDDAVLARPAGTVPRVDYLALADARSYAPVRADDSGFSGAAVLAVAARVGTTRLIDNVPVQFGTEPHAADD